MWRGAARDRSIQGSMKSTRSEQQVLSDSHPHFGLGFHYHFDFDLQFHFHFDSDSLLHFDSNLHFHFHSHNLHLHLYLHFHSLFHSYSHLFDCCSHSFHSPFLSNSLLNLRLPSLVHHPISQSLRDCDTRESYRNPSQIMFPFQLLEVSQTR